MKILNIDNEPFHTLRYRTSGPKGKILKKNLPFIKVQVDSLPNGLSSCIATSDLQGRTLEKENQLLGQAVAYELSTLYELKEIPKVDVVILAGDLYDYPDCRKLGGTGDVTEVWNSFATKFEYVIGVHGNHDTVIEQKLAHNVSILDGNSVTMKGATFGGVSGIIGRTDRNHRKTETEFEKALLNASRNLHDFIILHEAPDEPKNQQRGNPLIRKILERRGKSIVIAGHHYWESPLTTIGQNQVLNVNSRLFLFEDANET